MTARRASSRLAGWEIGARGLFCFALGVLAPVACGGSDDGGAKSSGGSGGQGASGGQAGSGGQGGAAGQAGTGGAAGQSGTGGQAGSSDSGVPFGGTLAMSMHTTQGLADWQASYDLGEQAGVNGAQIILPWGGFEPSVGNYNLALLAWDGLGLAALEGRKLEVLLTFPSIDVSAPTVPSDLAGVAFDDPKLDHGL